MSGWKRWLLILLRYLLTWRRRAVPVRVRVEQGGTTMQKSVGWVTQDQLVPGGASYTQYRVEIRQGGAAVNAALVPFTQALAQFEVAPGTGYTAAVVLTDAAGTATGPGAVSDAFDVAAPEPTLAVPVSVSVS